MICCLVSDLGVEVSSLVLIDKLSDPFSLGLPGICKTLAVSFVGLAQVKMVGRLLDVDGHSLVVEGECDATCVPRIKLTIAEDDVRSLCEIFLWVVAAKV